MLEKSIAIINKFQGLLQSLALPFTCIFCRRPAKRQQDLCQPCLEDLPIVAHKCLRCAQKLAGPVQEAVCGACLQNPPFFAAAYSLFAYEAPLTTLILALKFHQKLVYARLLGELLAAHIQKEWYLSKPLPELLIPVPLHNERLKERGFNQALEIARPLGQLLALPIEAQALKRIKDTPAQLGLSAEKRKQNLKNAFVYEGKLAGKTVAILDDVMTTGSTMNEVARALLQQGAARVEAWCCARR